MRASSGKMPRTSEKNPPSISAAWKDPFFRVPVEIITSKEFDLTPIEKLTYIVLCKYANKTGEAWPFYNTIADGVGCSRRAAITAVARLVEVGLVEKIAQYTQSGDQTSNRYIVYHPEQLRKKNGKPSANEGSYSPEIEDAPVDRTSYIVEEEILAEPPRKDTPEERKEHPADMQKSPSSERRSLIRIRCEVEGFKKTIEDPSITPDDRKAKAETLTPELTASIAAAVARIQRAGKTSTMQDVFQPLLE